jgi:hypothetical protein
LSRIDAPLIRSTNITFFNQLLFNTPQLCHFIDRPEVFKASQLAVIRFVKGYCCFTLPEDPEGNKTSGTVTSHLDISITCEPSDWQLSSIAQVFSSSLTPFSTLVHLDIGDANGIRWEDDMENTQWRELLQPFPSVEDLDLSTDVARLALPALQEFADEGVTDVLPALKNITIKWPSGPMLEAIDKFVSARQLSGHPVAVLYDGQKIRGKYARPL